MIKSLLLPILNYLFISIPNPKGETLKAINDIFFEFQWTGPAKIKQNVVVKQYCEAVGLDSEKRIFSEKMRKEGKRGGKEAIRYGKKYNRY